MYSDVICSYHGCTIANVLGYESGFVVVARLHSQLLCFYDFLQIVRMFFKCSPGGVDMITCVRDFIGHCLKPQNFCYVSKMFPVDA